MNYDIVYILKEDIAPAELTYSLRSIEKNFPHRNVWFVGGQPNGLYPDKRLPHQQIGNSKWERVKSSWKEIINCEDISEDFFLFNDDFFVLKPHQLPFLNYSWGTLDQRVKQLDRNLGRRSNYGTSLHVLDCILRDDGYTTKNFALHLPMLLNKEMIEKTFKTYPNNNMFRSAYGNINNIQTVEHPDVKIYDLKSIPREDWDYVSTTEQSFGLGNVGRFIRAKFPEESRFEIPTDLAKSKS